MYDIPRNRQFGLVFYQGIVLGEADLFGARADVLWDVVRHEMKVSEVVAVDMGVENGVSTRSDLFYFRPPEFPGLRAGQVAPHIDDDFATAMRYFGNAPADLFASMDGDVHLDGGIILFVILSFGASLSFSSGFSFSEKQQNLIFLILDSLTESV